jgi:hypothetical protein
MRKFILISCLFLTPLQSFSEISSMTIAGNVVSFDQHQVTLQIDKGQQIKVPRKKIQRTNLRSGEALLVSFEGKNDFKSITYMKK